MAGMEFVVWRDEYRTGHDELDRHHRRMFDMINRLYHAAANDATQAELDEMLNEMTEYARIHFKAEEEALNAVKYPLLRDQRRAHEVYVREVDKLRRSPFVPSHALSQDMLRFMKNWWLSHILKMDKEYVPFLAARPEG